MQTFPSGHPLRRGTLPLLARFASLLLECTVTSGIIQTDRPIGRENSKYVLFRLFGKRINDEIVVGVKNMLAEHAAGFISLHDVLTRMTQTVGATYQESAIALYRLLSAAGDHRSPQWKFWDDLRGKQALSDRDALEAWECLVQAARSGVPEELDDEIPF